MKVIGITGGVGCGKSTVLTLLKEQCNAYIIMADEVAKELMRPNAAGFSQVVGFFGEEILDSHGEIDRPKLAGIIFGSPNKRMVLNSIIHPLVKKTIMEKITQLRIEGLVDYVFVEAALLIEDHYEVICDELWYIYAPVEVRRKRLKESRGYSDEKIESMLKSQLSENEFREKCNVVINNGKGLDFTRAQLVKLC